MADGMAHAVVPEDDVSGIAVTVCVRHPVHLFQVRLIRGGSFEAVPRGEIGIEFPMAARPDGESAALRPHVVNVSHDAEVKGMGVHVATQGTGRRVSLGQDAVNAADAIGVDQRSFPQELFRHAHHGRIGGQESQHPVLSAGFPVLPHEPVPVGRAVVDRFGKGSDPGCRFPAFEGRRQVPPHAFPSLGHQVGVQHAALDQVAFADEETDVVVCKTDHAHQPFRYGWKCAENI